MPEFRYQRTDQPQVPAGTNQIYSGLAFAWFGSNPKYEVVTGSRVTTDNTTKVATAKGIGTLSAIGQVNTEWAKQFITTSNGAGTGDFTLVALANPSSGSTPQHIFAQKNDAGGSPFAQCALIANAGNNGLGSSGNFSFLTYNTVSSGVASAGGTAVDGNWHLWAAVRRGTSHELYRDGILIASSSLTVRSISQASRYTAIGSRGNGTTEGYSRNVSMAAGFNRALLPSEIATISANPWQVFAPVQRSIWEPVAAGGPVTHDTSGALAGQLGSIAGTAAHVAVHNTNGTPTGQLGSVAGSAARLRAFSSTGALTGQGASIVGSAARAGGATTHDTTGTPTGQGSAVVGTAAHVAIHGTSGTLVGTSALLAGTAVHNIPHGTSGDLTGPGSVVVGSALNGLASVTKSGVNRLWLIDYYTKEFAAKERLRNPEPAKTKVVAKKRAAEVAAKVEASVAKAEKDLATLTKSMKDVQDAQVFIYNAIQQAKQAPQAEPVDFMAVAKRYEKKVQQEEHELLLLAMVL